MTAERQGSSSFPSEGKAVFCTGEVSYDARVELPHGVFSTLEKAQASVALRRGETWKYDAVYKEWTVRRSGAADHDEIIVRYEIDAE